MRRAIFWLKVSRPGLWFQTLWLYTLPTSGLPIFHSPVFWLGLVYVTFPLNFLVYGWNDIVDFENDQQNPRKDSFLFGARGSREDLARLPVVIALVQLPFFIAFNWLARLDYGGASRRNAYRQPPLQSSTLRLAWTSTARIDQPGRLPAFAPAQHCTQ